MHGRLKVRTTEEEKAQKKKERQEKLKFFKVATEKIKDKRQQGELDEELLDITGKVLSSNPDISTLWNIRREILMKFSKDECLEVPLSKHYDTELQLTEYCLKVNPKSYCAWHQRKWVLSTRDDPDWKIELELCDKYLKFDERNFHTWDYRRFVVSQCRPPLKEEFDFTTEKLNENFSNYSAWHYRSKMLVELFPDEKEGRPIEDKHHKNELKMIQSATFTDPDDSSAWFYQRWLLGAVKKNIDLVVCTITPTKTSVAFNQYVSGEYVQNSTYISINDTIVDGDWSSCTGYLHDKLWIFKHNVSIVANMRIKVHYEISDIRTQIISCNQLKPSVYVGRNHISFRNQYSDPVLTELKEQLPSCRQLLALEPNNKWTLLTTTVFLYCIDANIYHKEVIKNLKTLQEIDSLRAGYYSDLITKWCIENQLYEDYRNDSLSYEIRFDEKVSSLPHLQYYSYCENVDLSDQNLTNKDLPSLKLLQNCKTLSLKNNRLTSLKGFPDLPLEELDIQGNDFEIDYIKRLRAKFNCRIFY